MSQEIGEARESWGQAVWAMAENFANSMKKEKRPFYLVYAAKHDPGASQTLGAGAFRQTMKAYYSKPPAILGILVWYVDNAQGIFEFVPELSAPPDVPLDAALLSDNSSDVSERVAHQGKQLNVLRS